MADTSPRESTVGEIMSRPVVTVRPAETVADAATIMRERKVGSVVVVDADERPIGILTERDMIRVAAAGSDASTAKVSEWMTPEPDTVPSDMTARAAFGTLSEHGYRHIPVVDDGRLSGIVSMRDLMKIAMIQPAEAQAHEVPKGLEGVVVAETTVGDVRGLEGFYHYRQYSAIDLAKTRPLEDVWQLMFEGKLPETLAERERFAAEIRRRRAIPEAVREVLPAIARAGDTFIPLDALRTAVSQYGAALGMKASHDIDHATLYEDAMATCAVVPTLICALWRLRQGLEVIDPNDDLGYAANYLYMMHGEGPPPEYAAGVEKYLISTIDHGFNASTFTARRHHVDGRRPRRRRRGRHRRAVGPAARRCTQSRAPDARRDRHRRPSRGLAAVGRRARRPPHGLRPPRLQDRRPALAHAARGGRPTRRREDGAGAAHRGHRDPRARRAQTWPALVHERGVLRGHRHGPVRRTSRAVHADVRREPGHRLVHAHPRTGRRQPADPPERAVRRPTATAARPADPVAATTLTDDRAAGLNEFFGPRAPGLLGVVFDTCTADEVVGHIDVSGPLIAGTGFLFAPAVIALADTLAAAGTGEHIDFDANESFTTIELKCNFLGSAREGERVVGRCVPVHVGRSTHVWDVTVTNETTGRTIALFRNTQMVLRPR